MRIGSLFSGYGGLDMAVAGVFDATTAWVSDIDPGPCKVLAHRFPDAPNLGDVSHIDWSTVEPVDIICGGYPCQPFSHAGRRLGQEDERHLWPYVADAVAALRPSLVVFENVRGHLSLGFDEVIRDLHQLGYDVEWVLVKASDLGACHQRARLFILGVNRERRVRSRLDRRGGVHRHPGDRRVVPGAPQGQHDRQGTSCAPCASEDVWRQGGARQGGYCDEPSVPYVATHRGVRGERHPAPEAPVLGEGGGCGHRAGVRCDADRLTEASEPWPLLDGRDARQGSDAEASDSGGEPARTGPRAAHAAGCEAAGGLPLGLVVGAGGQSAWPGGVRGATADEWPDDLGAHLRAATSQSEWGGLLGTPADTDQQGLEGQQDQAGASQAGRQGYPVTGAGRPDLTLLPTPSASVANDGEGADTWLARRERVKLTAQNGNGMGMPLTIAVQLLPTPAVADTQGGRKSRSGDRNDELLLNGIAHANRWGEYAAAIARWEAIHGPAPAPTMLGSRGQPQLSPAFTEWMMGLPAGWVTDVPGVTRNEALKLCGNGVLPLQAEAALRHMLTAPTVERAA